jgi:iron-sulfur cluster assembly accessory protein
MTIETKIQSVTLSPAAAGVVRDMIKERNLDETYALRIYIAGRTCSGFQYGMALDKEARDTDSSFESEGLKLLVDEQSIEYLAGCMVDFIDDERGKGFMVDNPNQAPACSCDGGSCGD